MNPASLAPSAEIPSHEGLKLDTDRPTRSERVDYKALHSGRPVSSSSKKESSTAPAEIDAGTLTSSTRMSLSAQRSAAREQKLRADPLVEVHGPVDVTCKRCGTGIKLSTKSTYDPFHWHRHIERCSRRPAKVLKQIRDGKGKERRKRTSGPKPNIPPLTSRPHKSLRIRRTTAEDTPPLTPDFGDDGQPAVVKEESPAPQSLASSGAQSTPQPETPTHTPLREPDVAFEEYLLRSRRRQTRDFSPLSLEGGQSWSWSQLKEPVWVVASYPNPDDAKGATETFGDSVPPPTAGTNILPPAAADTNIMRA